MLSIDVSQTDIEQIKDDAREAFPGVKSSHRVEAISRGLGFATNAAMRVAVGGGSVRVDIYEGVFVTYLHEHGFEVQGHAFLRICAFVAIRGAMAHTANLTHFGLGTIAARRKTTQEQQFEIVAGRKEMLSNSSADEFLLALEYISRLEKRKSLNKNSTSYGLKHMVERYEGEYRKSGRIAIGYVSNGMFIAAAIHAGLDMAPSHYGSPNAVFNISQRSLNASGRGVRA